MTDAFIGGALVGVFGVLVTRFIVWPFARDIYRDIQAGRKKALDAAALALFKKSKWTIDVGTDGSARLLAEINGQPVTLSLTGKVTKTLAEWARELPVPTAYRDGSSKPNEEGGEGP